MKLHELRKLIFSDPKLENFNKCLLLLLVYYFILFGAKKGNKKSHL